AQGATNALWTWCPTAYGFTSGAAQRYYPGDAYVDWICSDGYNWAPGRPDAQWRSFKEIFKDFYTWGAARNKPLMVGETGTEERNAGEKAGWYSGIVPAMKDYPAMKALIYFDTATTDLAGGWFEWRPDTSNSAYNAYIGMAREPYLNQTLGVPDPPPPPVDRSLLVSVEGPGSVSASGIDMTCTSTCTELVPDGTRVTLSATATGSGGFVAWGGACSGASNSCTLDMNSDKSVLAKFAERRLKAPKVTKPSKRLQDSSSITVAWTDDNPEAGLTYELRTVSGSNRQNLSDDTPLVQGVGGIETIMMDGDPGRTYCFAVRALGAGVISDWSERVCTSVPLDDTALNRKGRWSRKSASKSYGGSYSISKRRGARLVRRNVKAKNLALLARSCPRCGKVKVLWNRRSLGRFDLRSRRAAREIDVATFDNVKTGTVKIIVASKNRRVRIDGVGLSHQ
ncbi:MAG: hypothetical protein M3198_03830, partial [Actinomycetota bacterium]|nr:hypothetical protein [Actinomycetota bacterium]